MAYLFDLCNWGIILWFGVVTFIMLPFMFYKPENRSMRPPRHPPGHKNIRKK